MSDWAISQKCLSADATTQNRRHSEQVTTAEHKNVTAWEVKSEANRYAGLLAIKKLSTAATASFGE
eukprot:CAMPEP_0181438084 /NCGR_PEP_ID=MMETSP1110-20121109/21722_1 /TAXON_ID=174948 /ORGANISM="Symbiodinium sp., Strain CCMP421" /LENGTH=65 /DNA_ID=CAMNT_0023561751 /DNA_START=208 /DNA_END=405 /DNA_ORIENTATION=-